MALQDSLKDLQETLQELKRVHGSRLRLEKSRGSDAPFPIKATLTVQTPHELHAYDVSGFEGGHASGIEVEVSSKELPSALKQKMANTLAEGIRFTDSDQAWTGLAALFARAQADFQALITSLPELVEAYESVDAQGASARRFVINDPESHLEMQRSAPRDREAIHQAGTPYEAALAQRPPNEAGHSKADESQSKAAPEASGNEALQSELAYLERRYRSAFKLASSSQRSADAAKNADPRLICFTLALTPTDPAWQYGHQTLNLIGEVSPMFPELDSARLTVSHHHAPLRADVTRVLDGIIAAQLQRELARGLAPGSRGGPLRDVIRSLENHAGEFLAMAGNLLSEAKTKRKSQPENSATVAMTEGAAQMSLEDQSEAEPSGASESTVHETTDPGTSEDESAAATGLERPISKLEGATTQLLLDGLRLDNIIAVEPLQLNIQVACSRCDQTWDVSLAATAVGHTVASEGKCGGCGHEWSSEARTALLHDFNNVAASLRLRSCMPRDLLPSLFSAQCEGCSSVVSFRSVQIGQPSYRNCTSCHMHMGMSFHSATFATKRRTDRKLRAGPRTATIDPASRAERARFDGALSIGSPLPAMGTCRHYPHSHRWLRFPCCGRRFPCDLCHEEATDGHEMKWASRHVCGFCSTEQKIDDKCAHCNKRLAFNSAGALGSGTRHWEGGQGCRDKKRLDRRDRAKYRGSKHKTMSKKAFRVGAEAANRRDAKAH